MSIFYFLGVGPPCHSILCQFWLCEEAQCVYLRRHLGSCKEDFNTHRELEFCGHGLKPQSVLSDSVLLQPLTLMYLPMLCLYPLMLGKTFYTG